jgi:hypothetical protein
MHKIPQIAIYARQAGAAISPHERRSEGQPTESRTVLRFFRLERGSNAIRFVAEPAEAFTLYDKMHRIARDGGQESFNRSFTSPDGEVQASLTVESWARNGKSGYALSVQRGGEQLKVPVQSDQFMNAAKFHRQLSL